MLAARPRAGKGNIFADAQILPRLPNRTAAAGFSASGRPSSGSAGDG